MATHCCILPAESHGQKNLEGYKCIGSQRVRHDWSNLACVASLVAQRLKHLPATRETWVQSLGREDPLEKEWQPTPVFFPGESHGWRSLVGYSPRGCKESDTTEWLPFTHRQAFTINSTQPRRQVLRRHISHEILVNVYPVTYAGRKKYSPRKNFDGTLLSKHKLVSCIVVSILTVWENFMLTLSLQSNVIQSTQEEWKWKSLSHVQLFATPWTVSCQAPLSMEFSRPEYWSG